MKTNIALIGILITYIILGIAGIFNETALTILAIIGIGVGIIATICLAIFCAVSLYVILND